MNVSFPTFIQATGLTIIAAAAAYWIATGTQSVLFVTAGMVLVALGAYVGMTETVNRHLNTANGEQPQ